MTDFYDIECKFCQNDILQIPLDWIVKNGRVFCGNCCKSFEVRAEKEPELPFKKEERTEDTKDEKVEAALEELEKEIDKAIDEYSWF